MDLFQYTDGELCAEAVPIRHIADDIGTPFYCYSTATLERHYRVFADAFAAPQAPLCYALKANGNLGVIRTFADLGAGADVVSEGELRKALAGGIPANRIVFSGFGKTGVPTGIQIVGRSYEDVKVFRAGMAFEKAAPWLHGAAHRPDL